MTCLGFTPYADSADVKEKNLQKKKKNKKKNDKKNYDCLIVKK